MKVKSADIPCRPTICSHPPQTCHSSVLVRRAKEGDLLQIYYVPTIIHTGLLRVGPYSTPIKDFSPSRTQSKVQDARELVVSESMGIAILPSIRHFS